MADRQKIMIVDNDKVIAEPISLYLTKEYYETLIVPDGKTALEQFPVYQPDLILLDLMMPGMDGFEICRQLRKVSTVPIIIISVKSELFDRVLALELGADDFIIKPFDNKELVARIRAIMRRTDPEFVNSVSQTAANAKQKIIEYPDLTINLSNYTVICGGSPLDMPPKEIELLYFLAASPNQVFTREQLLSDIWGYDYAGGTRTVDVHIKRIRAKLHQSSYWSISTVWSVGYKFNLY